MVFTREDAARAAQTIGIDFKKEAFQLEDLLNGMNTELARHGTKAGTVDVTHDDPTMTAKLAVANLRVSPSYYSQRVGKSAWERSLARGVKHKGAKTEYKTVEFELEGFDDMEGLKLIDLGNEVSYIDVDTSKVPYTFSVKLGDRTFAFSIRYNEVGGFFTVDLSIASTGEVLVYGDIVRYGRPLFNSVEDERFPVPVIMPLCLTGDDISEVTFENFGKEVRLYLWERNAA